jgi:hypothetical protein
MQTRRSPPKLFVGFLLTFEALGFTFQIHELATVFSQGALGG